VFVRYASDAKIQKVSTIGQVFDPMELSIIVDDQEQLEAHASTQLNENWSSTANRADHSA
jgi:hypothetical protein